MQEKTKSIYYLGGKGAFTSEIKKVIDELTIKKNGRICDLFSGSGVVGHYLSRTNPVTTVDIQEYSRVLSSAYFNLSFVDFDKIELMLESILSSELFNHLYKYLNVLIEYEIKAIEKSKIGDFDDLLEIIEGVPLIANEEESDLHTVYDLLKRDCQLGLLNSGIDLTKNTTTLRYFGGIYFSYYQSLILDMILGLSDKVDDNEKDFVVALALCSASTLVNTIGKQFAQPLRPRNKDGSVKKNIHTLVSKDRILDPVKIAINWLNKYRSYTLSGVNSNSKALRMDYLSAIRNYGHQFSVVYADPPYTRDHYSRFYHVLETMALRDEPQISVTTRAGKVSLSRGIYREIRHQSPFCIRSKAIPAFEDLFCACRDNGLPLVLSYSPHEEGDGTHPRVVSTKNIIESASAYFNDITVIPVDGITHNKFNKRELELDKRHTAEILIKCDRPK